MRGFLILCLVSRVAFAEDTKSSGRTVTTSKCVNSRTGVWIDWRRNTTALDRFMPVMIPTRSPSRTNNALLSISCIMWPAASMVSPASMKAAGCRNSSEIRERINEP